MAPKRSATPPTNGETAPISRAAKAIPNDHTSRPMPRSTEIGFMKMPKLCRAPMPMVRIAAPHQTGIQKLRVTPAMLLPVKLRDGGVFVDATRDGRHEHR